MTMRKILAFASILCVQLLFSGHTNAGTITDAQLLKLGLDNGAPDVLFIRADKAKDTQASCHSNSSWAYVLPLTTEQNKKVYAMILAARAGQSQVTLVGSGACNVFSGIETLLATYY